jgi:putative ABC transport system substrate-binding protein
MVKSVQDVSSTIPIVFLNVPDSVLTELVGSVSRPNRNATGFINFDSPMAGKWLELLKETVPVLSQAGVLLHAGNATAPGYLHAIEAAASALSIKLSPASASDARAIEQVMSIWAGQRNSGFVVPPSSLANTNQGLIISLAVKYRLPAIYSYPESVKAGGLMSYGFDRLDSYRKTAEYVDRVLRGAKINELPVQAPTKFELVINLKAAKAIGLDVPSILLARADEVIE